MDSYAKLQAELEQERDTNEQLNAKIVTMQLEHSVQTSQLQLARSQHS